MSGFFSDVSSVFSSVGDAVSNFFGSGAGSAATDAASAASDAASTASDVASAASSVPAGFNFASDAAGTAASSGDAISNAASYLDNAAAASYTSGVATGSWGSLSDSFNAAGAATGLAPGSSYLGATAYDAINNGHFNINDFSGLDPNAPAFTNMALASATMGPSAAQTSTGQSWLSKLISPSSASSASTDPLAQAISKMATSQLIAGLGAAAIQGVGAYKASQPKPPANFSGRTPGGGGGGLGMHTVNGGFGLAAGGTQSPPTGVPSQLQPNPQAEALGGSGGLTPVQPPNGAPNLQQTVANQAGVGGLIPQGSVNYMKGGPNG